LFLQEGATLQVGTRFPGVSAGVVPRRFFRIVKHLLDVDPIGQVEMVDDHETDAAVEVLVNGRASEQFRGEIAEPTTLGPGPA